MKVQADEFGPVGDGAMDDASGADSGRIISAQSGFDHLPVGGVAAGLVRAFLVPGGAKPADLHLQGPENPLLHEIFPGFIHNPLGHMAGDGESGVGVNVFCAGRSFGWFDDDIFEK